MADFCGLNCFCYELGTELPATEMGTLSPDIELVLSDQMESDKYTRLTLCGPFGCEIIKVANKAGVVCITGRGEEGTTIRAWEKGSKIKYETTVQNHKDMIACETASTTEEEVAPFKSEAFSITYDESTQKWCIEPKEEEKDSYGEKSFKVGKFKWTLTQGTWCRTALDASQVSPAGKYPCATVCVDADGCVTYTKGETLSGKCSCGCGCTSEDTLTNIYESSATQPLVDSGIKIWFDETSQCTFFLSDGLWVSPH